MFYILKFIIIYNSDIILICNMYSKFHVKKLPTFLGQIGHYLTLVNMDNKEDVYKIAVINI